MKALKTVCFKHIYVEKNIKDKTKDILEKFSDSEIIYIDNYLEIFGRKKQSFAFQKKNPSLILAKKNGKFLYPNPPYCQNFGFERSFYTSIILNCLFDCSYCFLKGMYDSANIVFFLNIEDFFLELEKEEQNGNFLLFLSYDTDLLSFENICGFIHKFHNFLSKHKNITTEIRTKSSNFSSIEHLKPLDNLILAWSLLPDEIIKEFENSTPPLKNRLFAINKAIEKGWKVRLVFDPIITTDSIKIYEKFFKKISLSIDISKILDISCGPFRMNQKYLKKILSLFSDLKIRTDKEMYHKIIEQIKLTFSNKILYSIYDT
ncbi:MAG: hypothetical protein N2258_07580 [Brevinematales bacterium]|nr:hypothetical protein [Brevinematales bacterium]